MRAIRVLLVDDHAIVTEGLRHLLEAEGDVEVVGVCQGGRAALSVAARLAPDILVMDIAMPDLNGIEATRLLGERTACAKVIILSMFANAEHVRRALQAGAKGYLVKKAAARELVDAVRAVHAGGHFISESLMQIVLDGFSQSNYAESALDRLSTRERQVLQLLVEGTATQAIAKTLTLSPRTVETYRTRLMDKLGIADLPGLVKFAIHHGLTTLE